VTDNTDLIGLFGQHGVKGSMNPENGQWSLALVTYHCHRNTPPWSTPMNKVVLRVTLGLIPEKRNSIGG